MLIFILISQSYIICTFADYISNGKSAQERFDFFGWTIVFVHLWFIISITFCAFRIVTDIESKIIDINTVIIDWIVLFNMT